MPFVNHLLIGNLWRPGQTPEQTVYALVPIGTPGISVVARESQRHARRRPVRSPAATIGDELDAMVYFDDVLIPWAQVQHIGNPDHAKWYPQRQFDWVHLETQIRHCVHAELMVGLGTAAHAGARHKPAARWCRRSSPSSSASAKPAALS